MWNVTPIPSGKVLDEHDITFPACHELYQCIKAGAVLDGTANCDVIKDWYHDPSVLPIRVTCFAFVL
ncbi:hypothetical protein WDB86_05190 [Thioclava sp. GXIMD4215]